MSIIEEFLTELQDNETEPQVEKNRQECIKELNGLMSEIAGLSASLDKTKAELLDMKQKMLNEKLSALIWALDAGRKEKNAGTSYDIKISGSYSNGFRIILPGIPGKRIIEKTQYDYDIEKSAEKAINAFLEKNELRVPVYDRARVVITLYMGKDFTLARVPDADNLCIKGIIDALGMSLIRNDNLLSMELTIKGGTADIEKTYTEILVTEIPEKGI